MKNLIKETIEYTGIVNDLSMLKNQDYFKQIVLTETWNIPDGKPKIEKIIRVLSAINILNKGIVGTPVLVSLGGQILTGKKSIVNGEVSQKIEYTANTHGQELHVEYSIIPFAVSIVLPDKFRIGSQLNVSGYINDANVRLINNTTLYKSINLIISVEC